ncbi:MAG TPA: hypothetical protein VL048_15900 [Xanthobacteraceae bacterium]|nr:hypothetical protein [Xanthobacteraceae bacterium]
MKPRIVGDHAAAEDTLGQSSERFLTEAPRPLLQKPFLPADVRRLIEELLAAVPA